MTLKEQGMQAVIDSQESLIRELIKELRRLRLNNIKMKMHLQVIIGNPACKTSEDLKQKYKSSAAFSESILHYN